MARRDRFALVACALAVAVAVLALGSATRWGQAAVAAVAVVTVALTLRSRRRFERWPPLVVLLLAAIGWTTIQLLPLPSVLVEAATPVLEELRQDGANLAGVSSASTFSVDPPATLRALVFLLSLSGIAFVALRISVTERGRYALAAAVAATAGLAAIIAGVHELVGATALYGVYEPRQGVPAILGPLLNTNHLGCLMAVGAVTSIGLLLYPKQPVGRRVAWAVGGIACVAVATATYSRGAVIGLAAGAVVTLTTLTVQRISALKDNGSNRRRERFLATTLPIGVMVTCGLVVAVYLGAGTVMQQLEGTTLDEIHAPRSKFEAWRNSFELVEESPWVGVGRGAFESAFTRVHPASAFYTFSHPENEAVQAVTEWGIPATIVLAGLAAWVMLLALRRWRDGPLAAGALGAIMVVAFQSNFDFGMELLGLAVPVIVLLSTLTYVPLTETGAPHRRQAVRIAHLVAILVGAVLLMTPATRTITDDHAALANHPTRETIEEAIEAHPFDYVAFAALAEKLGRANDPSAARVLNHAMRLHPTHAGMHWIAARLFFRSGRLSQAEAEYSTAIRYSLRPRPLIAELVSKLPRDRAARALPTELYVDETVRTLRELGHPEVAVAWLDRVVRLTGDPRALEALFTSAMAVKDYDMAERAARQRCQTTTPRCQIELAKVLTMAGKTDAVIATLKDVASWQGRPADRVTAWLMLCDSHAADHLDVAYDCLHRLDASGLVPPENREVQRRRNTWSRLPLPTPGQPSRGSGNGNP